MSMLPVIPHKVQEKVQLNIQWCKLEIALDNLNSAKDYLLSLNVDPDSFQLEIDNEYDCLVTYLTGNRPANEKEIKQRQKEEAISKAGRRAQYKQLRKEFKDE